MVPQLRGARFCASTCIYLCKVSGCLIFAVFVVLVVVVVIAVAARLVVSTNYVRSFSIVFYEPA